MDFKILKNPITLGTLIEFIHKPYFGEIDVYQFRRYNQVRKPRFNNVPMCDIYRFTTEYSDSNAEIEMFHIENPIGFDEGTPKQIKTQTPVEALNFINKMIDASKNDETIVVYACNVDERIEHVFKGSRTPTPRKTMSRKPVHKTALRKPVHKTKRI